MYCCRKYRKKDTLTQTCLGLKGFKKIDQHKHDCQVLMFTYGLTLKTKMQHIFNLVDLSNDHDLYEHIFWLFSICGSYNISVYSKCLVLITSVTMQEPTVLTNSTYSDVVGCNEQVLVPKISQLVLPYTCTLAERCHHNTSFIQKAALFYFHFSLCCQHP